MESAKTQSVEESSSTNVLSPKWLKRIPMITGVLAGLAGFLTVRSTNMSNQAIYNSNQAVLFQAQASDKWAEYQADSVKARIVETTLTTGVSDAAAHGKLMSDQEKFRAQQADQKADAQDFEAKRDRELVDSQAMLTERDLLNYAGVAAQLGIALASVAALTKKFAAFNVGLIAGLIGLGITGYALLMHYLAHH